jgi:hypothetical protein
MIPVTENMQRSSNTKRSLLTGFAILFSVSLFPVGLYEQG